MEIHISGRGVDVTPRLRRRVETKVEKVARVLPKITEARVVLGVERHRHIAEVTVQAKRATLRVEAQANDFHAAVDGALRSLERQACRRKERIQARKPRLSRGNTPAVEAEAAESLEGDVGMVLRQLSAKPMSVDEAVEQLRNRQDGLLIFTNARTHAVNVLRWRRDGQLELIQPSG